MMMLRCQDPLCRHDRPCLACYRKLFAQADVGIKPPRMMQARKAEKIEKVEKVEKRKRLVVLKRVKEGKG